MDHWINRPPKPTAFAGIRLLRVPAGRSLEGICTTPELIGCNTHYWHRHTTPCLGPSCPACLDGQPARWHGFVGYWSPSAHCQNVLELTALAAQPVIDYQDRHGTLRGATLKASRIGNRPNSPVQTVISPTDIDLRTLPKPIDLTKFLAVLWSLEKQDPTTPSSPDPRNSPRILTAAELEPDTAALPIDRNDLIDSLFQQAGNGHKPKPR
jgi:hypothetical protein